MKFTQEELDVPLKDVNGSVYNFSKEEKLTLRLLLGEVILSKDTERSGDERIKGFNLVNKFNERFGEIKLDDAEVKLITLRMEKALITTSSDFLYGTLHVRLNRKDPPDVVVESERSA